MPVPRRSAPWHVAHLAAYRADPSPAAASPASPPQETSSARQRAPTATAIGHRHTSAEWNLVVLRLTTIRLQPSRRETRTLRRRSTGSNGRHQACHLDSTHRDVLPLDAARHHETEARRGRTLHNGALSSTRPVPPWLALGCRVASTRTRHGRRQHRSHEPNDRLFADP
jgi:hypothetical protein